MSGLAGLGASVALKASGIGGELKKMPPAFWYVIGALVFLAIGGFLHHHASVKHDAALVQKTNDARDKMWQQRFEAVDAKAQQVRKAAETLQNSISAKTKEKFDAQVRTNARAADALSLRGPGKAAAVGCRPGDPSGVPAAASGPQPAAPGADAPAAQVPAGNGVAGVPVSPERAVPDSALAVVPWSWLTDRGKEFDDLLAETAAWHAWWPAQQAAYEAMRHKLMAGDKAR